jgi:hypothetical protein
MDMALQQLEHAQMGSFRHYRFPAQLRYLNWRQSTVTNTRNSPMHHKW